MEAMYRSVSPPLTSLGGCNQGFLRDDAILVVTFITDEPDEGSIGTVETWRQALIDAKGGNEEAIYVLGIFSDADLPQPICNRDPAPRLRQFLNSWGDRGHACSICANDYSSCLSEAIDDITTTCEEFVTE